MAHMLHVKFSENYEDVLTNYMEMYMNIIATDPVNEYAFQKIRQEDDSLKEQLKCIIGRIEHGLYIDIIEWKRLHEDR
eukprot:UN19354